MRPPNSAASPQHMHQHQQHQHPYGHYHLRHASLIGSGHRRSLLALLSLLAAASLWIGHTRLHQAPGGLPQQQLLASNTSSSSSNAAALAAAGKQHAKQALAGLLGRGSSSSAPPSPQQPEAAGAGIPRIIHQNYLAGGAQLLVDALKPMSHFRKEWWLSCKTHHPGFLFFFWDAARCEDLLQQHYPWFIPTWRALGNSTVLKSDAIRPFILQTFGGIYLDLDVECFTDCSPWLAGADVVLQAEVSHTINNAQMASVPGHALWTHFQKAIQARVAAGKRWALDATGPHVLTAVVRELVSNTKADLPGRYDLADGSRLVVYGAKQFFTPCSWNDWGCAVELARDKPRLRAAGRAAAVTAAARAATRAAAVAAAAAAANASVTGVLQRQAGTLTPQAVTAAAASAAAARSASLPFMLDVQAVAGVHHFSGSWLGLDGSKSLSLRREGKSGVASWLFNGSGFVEQPCQQLRLLPRATAASSSPHYNKAGSQQTAAPAAASGAELGSIRAEQRAAAAAGGGSGVLPVPVCWEDITAAAAAHSCNVLSVRPHLGAACSGPGSEPKQQLGAELALAAAGCRVTLVTPHSIDPKAAAAPASSAAAASLARAAANITALRAVLSVARDPFAEPPAFTLDGLLAAVGLGGTSSSRVTLLVLDAQPDGAAACGSSSGSSDALDVLNALHVSSSPALTGVDAAVLLLPAWQLQQRQPGAPHKAFAAYQHLCQERGFAGFYHSAAAQGSQPQPGVALGLRRPRLLA